MGTVAAAMATVTDHWDHHLPVLLVVRENAFESIAQVVELRVRRHLRLQNARLHTGRLRTRAAVDAVASILAEEVGARLCRKNF